MTNIIFDQPNIANESTLNTVKMTKYLSRDEFNNH